MLRILANIREYFDTRRVPLRRFIGLAVSIFTLLSLVGCFSYLFTWKQDQSLLLNSEMLSSTAYAADNLGGKTGLRLAALFVGKWFGLGAFAVVFALSVLSLRLLFGRRRFSVLKTIVLALTGAALASYILAYISLHLGLENVFGGGLGGECGSLAVQWLESLVGSIVTVFILLVLCAIWAFFSSRKFSEWFVSFGRAEDAPETVSEGSVPQDNAQSDLGTEESAGKKPDHSGNISESSDSSFNFLEKNADVLSNPNEEEPEVPEVQKPEEKQSQNRIPTPSAVDRPASEPSGSSEIKVVAGQNLCTDVSEDLPRINVRDELQDYRFPTLDILKDYTSSIHNVSSEELKRNNFKIRATLETYKITVNDVVAVVGPTVTLYKVYPASGVKISSIMNLNKEIGMALGSNNLRIIMLPDAVGIEVPNDTPSVVPLKALLNDDAYRSSKAELPVAIGYTITQKVKVFDLADAPHLLVAGATKQGKSVGLNVLIASLLYAKHPSELKFVFIDPKMVEFSAYARLLHHYLAVMPSSANEDEEMANAIVKKAPDAEAVLRSLCVEMDERYELLNKAGVNSIILYNDKYRDRHLLPTDGHRYLPYIVTVIDEYSDLTMSTGAGGDGRAIARSITNSIIRLAQKGRAAGIHIVLATQRPSVDVITGLIKANFPTRIAYRVIQKENSQTILGTLGAEKLIGKGDMLYFAGVDLERVQCAFISNDEITALTKAIGEQQGYKKSYNTPYYLPSPDENTVEGGSSSLDVREMDERFEEAARMVVTSQRGSTSDLQRRLGMGYAKAGRVMDQLEKAGIVGPQEGSKPRQVLISDLDELDTLLKELKADN